MHIFNGEELEELARLVLSSLEKQINPHTIALMKEQLRKREWPVDIEKAFELALRKGYFDLSKVVNPAILFKGDWIDSFPNDKPEYHSVIPWPPKPHSMPPSSSRSN